MPALSLNSLPWGRLMSPLARIGRSQHRIAYCHLVAEQGHSYFANHVTPDVFDAQVRFLSQNFDVISLGEAVQRASRGEPLAGTVSITTDDGFVENFTNAAPILESHGATGTFFCVSSCVDNRWMMWRSQIMHLSQTVSEARLRNAMAGVASRFDLVPPAADIDAMAWTISWNAALKDTYVGELWRLCDIEPLDDFLGRSKPYLTSAQLQDLVRRGHEVGSHTATHPVCSSLTTAEFSSELKSSCEELTKLSGMAVRTFAYPFGQRAAPETEAELARAGLVDCMLGIRSKANNGSDTFSWERDNLEFRGFRSQFEFAAKPLIRRLVG